MARSFLDAIPKQLNAAFKGKSKLRTGTLRRETPVTSDLDGHGDAVNTTVQTWGFEGFRDRYSERTRAVSQIPDTDLQVNILAGSTTARPQKGDAAKIDGEWYELITVETDPAEALWVCQGHPIEDPTSVS